MKKAEKVFLGVVVVGLLAVFVGAVGLEVAGELPVDKEVEPPEEKESKGKGKAKAKGKASSGIKKVLKAAAKEFFDEAARPEPGPEPEPTPKSRAKPKTK